MPCDIHYKDRQSDRQLPRVQARHPHGADACESRRPARPHYRPLTPVHPRHHGLYGSARHITAFKNATRWLEQNAEPVAPAKLYTHLRDSLAHEASSRSRKSCGTASRGTNPIRAADSYRSAPMAASTPTSRPHSARYTSVLEDF